MKDMSWFEAMEARIPKGEVRTRFAPSPTGYMHVGTGAPRFTPILMRAARARQVHFEDRGHGPGASGRGRCGRHIQDHERMRALPRRGSDVDDAWKRSI